jgi:hypothetical protein
MFLGGKMSVYVSICCLGKDNELERTIENCFSFAENPQEVYIGLAMIGKEDFYKNISEKYKDNKNISIVYADIKDNIGIGRNRNLAASMYKDQDYFLQIDSHTYFIHKWDTHLIEQERLARSFVNNEKVILTSYAAGYSYDTLDNVNFYPIFKTKLLSHTRWDNFFFRENGSVIPKWKHTPFEECSEDEDIIKEIKKTGFAPVDKISAHFMFGNRHLAKNLSLPEYVIFWEEEILQSIELIDKGFTLLCPGLISPVFHIYMNHVKNDYCERDSIFEFYDKEDVSEIKLRKNMESNFLTYITDPVNIEKIKRFQDYCGIEFLRGKTSSQEYPTFYINSNIDIID